MSMTRLSQITIVFFHQTKQEDSKHHCKTPDFLLKVLRESCSFSFVLHVTADFGQFGLGHVRSLAASVRQYCLICRYRYHWRFESNPGAVNYCGLSSFFITMFDFNKETLISSDLLSSLQMTVPGCKMSNVKW